MANSNQPKQTAYPDLSPPDTLRKAADQERGAKVVGPADPVHTRDSKAAVTAADPDQPQKPPLWAKVAIGAGIVGIALLGISVGKKRTEDSDVEGIRKGEKVKTTVARAKRTAQRAEDWAEDTPVVGKVVDVSKEAGSKVERVVEKAADKVGSGVEKAAHGVKDAGHAIKDKGQDLGDKLKGAAPCEKTKADRPFWNKWFGGN